MRSGNEDAPGQGRVAGQKTKERELHSGTAAPGRPRIGVRQLLKPEALQARLAAQAPAPAAERAPLRPQDAWAELQRLIRREPAIPFALGAREVLAAEAGDPEVDLTAMLRAIAHSTRYLRQVAFGDGRRFHVLTGAADGEVTAADRRRAVAKLGRREERRCRRVREQGGGTA
jgi:hypothetical protein